jgi:hypothetical protein
MQRDNGVFPLKDHSRMNAFAEPPKQKGGGNRAPRFTAPQHTQNRQTSQRELPPLSAHALAWVSADVLHSGRNSFSGYGQDASRFA